MAVPPGGLAIDRNRHLRVSPLELFFDLVFVFAVTQVAALIRQDTSSGSVLRGVLILAMLWWAWQQYTWTINGVGTERLGARLVLLVAMGATLLTAIAVPDAFGDTGLRFAAGYVAVLLLALTFYWIAIRDLELMRAAFMRYLPLATLAAAMFLTGGLVDPPLRTILWVAGITTELVAAANANQADFQIRPGHFAERHQLFVILALGESIVAIGVAAAADRTLEVGLAMQLHSLQRPRSGGPISIELLTRPRRHSRARRVRPGPEQPISSSRRATSVWWQASCCMPW